MVKLGKSTQAGRFRYRYSQAVHGAWTRRAAVDRT